MVALLVRRQEHPEGGDVGEIILACHELPEGHTWGAMEDGDDTDPFCVMHIEDDAELEELCNRSQNACVSYPFSEWEQKDEVTPDPDNDKDEFVSETYVRLLSGGKRVPAPLVKQDAKIKVADLVEELKNKDENVVGRRPKTVVYKRPVTVVKELTP